MVLKSRATRLALEVLWGEDVGATDDPFVSNTLRELLGSQLIRGSTGALAKARKTLNFKGTVDLVDNQPLTATDVILGAEQVLSVDIPTSQNNWLPAGLPEATVVLANPTGGAVSITGIDATADIEAFKLIINVSASGTILLPHENASSAAANRFRNIGDATVTIGPGESAFLLRDTTFGRWLVDPNVEALLDPGDFFTSAELYDWVRADLCSVTAGKCTSMPGQLTTNDYAEATEANQPTFEAAGFGGRASILCSNAVTRQSLFDETCESLASGARFGMMVVGQSTVSPQEAANKFVNWDNGSAVNTGISLNAANTPANKYESRATLSDGTPRALSGIISDTDEHIWDCRNDATNHILNVDEVASTDTENGTSANAIDAIYIGAGAGGDENTGAGDWRIAMVVWFKTDPGEAKLAIFRDAVAAFYDNVITLP